jgi:hypothetical protein
VSDPVSVKVSSCSPPQEVGSGAGPRQTVLVEAGFESPELLSGNVAESGVA